MSIKSANETEGHLLKARDLDLFSPNEWQGFTGEVIEIRKMTYSYRRTMLANDAKANAKKPNDKTTGGNVKSQPETSQD